MAAGAQVMEDFWGVELSKNKKEVKWGTEDDDASSMYTETSLEVRQACLGASAKEGERNVVELTTDNEEGDEVKHTVLSMKVGGTEQSALFLTLRPPVTFKLVSGNGPVHIVGQVNETIDLNMMSSSDDDDEEEEEEVGVQNITSLKRLAPSQPKLTSKMAKTVPGDSMDMSNGEEEEDDDSEEDDDDADEEEDESEEEEEQEKVKPTPKKSQSNNKKNPIGTPHPKSKLSTFKTPQSLKSAGHKQKVSQSLPNTPKAQSDKKKGQVKGVPDLNEIKQRLAKMNVPKKLEKFNNFVSNSFKIKDTTVKKELWEFVQKNREVELKTT